MSNDAQTQKLLYSILSQKCLKDIKWQKVADDIGIESAHAARMRYSRFKDYMNGKSPSKRTRRSSTSSPRKPRVSNRNPRTPKKAKIEQSAEPSEGNIKTEKDLGDEGGETVGIKSEPMDDLDIDDEEEKRTPISPTPTLAPCSQPQTPFQFQYQQPSSQSSTDSATLLEDPFNFDMAMSFDMRTSEGRDFETRFLEMHESADGIVVGKGSGSGTEKGIKVEKGGWWEDEGSWKY